MVEVMIGFPQEIERWCCVGKSCGNTTLELISSGANTDPVLYDYVRVTNGNSYTGGWKTAEEMDRWLEETKDHIQEELDLEALEKRTDLKVLRGSNIDKERDSTRDFQEQLISLLEGQGFSVYQGAPPTGIYVSTEPVKDKTKGLYNHYETAYEAIRSLNESGNFTVRPIAPGIADLKPVGNLVKFVKSPGEEAELLRTRYVFNSSEFWKQLTEDIKEENAVTDEFVEKRQKLEAFLLNMATGLSWDDPEAEELRGNYMMDAVDILRGNPHLLSLYTREAMKLDGDQ